MWQGPTSPAIVSGDVKENSGLVISREQAVTANRRIKYNGV